ncbi:MAG: dihydropteroate synthase [Chloroflexi bacterium]|nr:dihydropteroate synthase [Chloroflexota bacterium]
MTTITSAQGEITFGVRLPTLIVGERINPSNRKKLAQELVEGKLEILAEEARIQTAAGAHVLDVNIGTPGVDEVAMLPRAVQKVFEVSRLPICIDSSNPEALIAALKVYPHKALVNSVTAEERSLSAILPAVKEFGAAVVGVVTNDGGVPASLEARFGAAVRIVDAALAHGIQREDIVIDCLALAAAVDAEAATVTLEAVRKVTVELGVSTILGVSNVSFGMPDRPAINDSFLSMAIAAGLTAAIVDPTVKGVVSTICAADFLAGRDGYGRRYLANYRKRKREEEQSR